MEARILICVDSFTPGFRAGGPISSCLHLARRLSHFSSVGVLTSDRDLGDRHPYPDIEVNRWVDFEHNVQVCYASPSARTMRGFYRAVNTFRPECVYLKGMFSWPGTLAPILLKTIGGLQPDVVVAPSGMLKPTAMSRRRWKKWPIVNALRGLGIASKVRFHATSDTEDEEIRRVFGRHADVFVAANIPRAPLETPVENPRQPGRVSLCFVGRIHPTKNPDFLLKLLRGVTLDCELRVVGPVEDVRYLRRCQKLTTDLPAPVKVVFAGAQTPENTKSLIANSDLFVLPTQGESFGHAIFEALGLGVPVLISDQTIWRDLERRRAGWDLPLSRPAEFARIIQRVAHMSSEEYASLRHGANTYAREFLRASELVPAYLRMFGIPCEDGAPSRVIPQCAVKNDGPRDDE